MVYFKSTNVPTLLWHAIKIVSASNCTSTTVIIIEDSIEIELASKLGLGIRQLGHMPRHLEMINLEEEIC